jgi:hypothetical protein
MLRGGMFHETSGRKDNAATELGKRAPARTRVRVTAPDGDVYTFKMDALAPLAALAPLLASAMARRSAGGADADDDDNDEDADDDEDEESSEDEEDEDGSSSGSDDVEVLRDELADAQRKYDAALANQQQRRSAAADGAPAAKKPRCA